MPNLRAVIDLLETWYPPSFADSWDRVGLVCGDPQDDVRRILLAVDPVQAVAREAVEWDADLVITHHPLYLKGTSSIDASTTKGRVVHDLIRNGCGLYAAHTNADAPTDGVSESIALALGLNEITPLDADPVAAMDKIVTFVPATDAEAVRTAMTDAGAGAIGDYDSCTFTSTGEGRFRPLQGADPAIGQVGALETVDEVKVEAVCRRGVRRQVVAALRAAHPYEEPAYDVLELAALDDPTRGSGRIGTLDEPVTLREFADLVAHVLPHTAHGVRVAGNPDQRVETVALCGGAGDFLLDTARARGADVYLTSDLRHHPASELREHQSMALVDVAHWAAEWMWLPTLRRKLAEGLGDTVETRVSTINTDPWNFRV